MKFNSQICTTREQSKRILALGLRKETADMALHFSYVDVEGNAYYIPYTIGHQCTGIPAWSLHRLIEMADTTYLIENRRDDDSELWMCLDKCYCWNNHKSFYNINLYDSLIDCIEWLIKEGYFNKEYLV